MRRTFADVLRKKMGENPDIYLLTGDLGFGMFDQVRDLYPERFINTGASEQAMMGIAVGLAQEGKIPFVYSITPFLLYRPFETIRNYLSHERANVKLVGGGRDRDYLHDGFSHWAEEARAIVDLLDLLSFWPINKDEVEKMVDEMLAYQGPTFISLERR